MRAHVAHKQALMHPKSKAPSRDAGFPRCEALATPTRQEQGATVRSWAQQGVAGNIWGLQVVDGSRLEWQGIIGSSRD